jgi:predicted nucleotidyltransferase
MKANIPIPKEQLAAFCRSHHIRRLESDIDLLVEFELEHIPGLLGMAHMELELSALLGGRKVDLRTPEDLSRYFRQRVLEEAEVQYAEEPY